MWDGIVVQWIKLPPAILGSYMALLRVPAAPFLIQFSSNVPAKTVEDGQGDWTSAILVGDLDETPCCWLPPGLPLVIVAIWGVKLVDGRLKNLFLSLFLSVSISVYLCNFVFEINNYLEKYMCGTLFQAQRQTSKYSLCLCN